MTLVRITKYWRYPDLGRQTPQRSWTWGDIRFTTDPVEKCDYLVVLDRVPEDLAVSCAPDRVWALMCEPPDEMHWLAHLGDPAYARVFTQDPRVQGPRYTHTQPALPWHVERDFDYLIRCSPPDKSRSLSWITSDTAWTKGHRARLDFLKRAREAIDFDLFGRGFRAVGDKWDAHAPYRYSIVVENHSGPYYWSEKLADCFLAWTIPVYYGCTRITDYFPAEAMVQIDIDDPHCLEQIRDAVASDRWQRRRDAIAYARELVLTRYQYFPFLEQEIRSFEHRQGAVARSQAATVYVPARTRPPLPAAARLWAEARFGTHRLWRRTKGKWNSLWNSYAHRVSHP